MGGLPSLGLAGAAGARLAGVAEGAGACYRGRMPVKISVVVPAFNEERLLGLTLEAIRAAGRAFEEHGWGWELVVCDNNSTDRTAEIAKGFGAKVVFEPVNQIARARNSGARVAEGEWLLFVDADSRPSAALFGAVIERIEDPRVAGGGACVEMDVPHRLGSLLVWGWNCLSRLRGWAAGSFIYCDAALFRRIKGFDERFYASEELDFSKRLKRAAKEEGRRLVIIASPRLVTSARKFKLYTPKEYRRFFFRLLARPRKSLGDPEACHIWYDGRR